MGEGFPRWPKKLSTLLGRPHRAMPGTCGKAAGRREDKNRDA